MVELPIISIMGECKLIYNVFSEIEYVFLSFVLCIILQLYNISIELPC